MALGIMLNSQFVAETKSLSIENSNEEQLFKALNRAFENLSAYKLVACQVIHGAKHFVSFDEMPDHPAFFVKDRGVNVKCELSDLLIISVNQREMRVCCLQNKYERKKPGFKFKITDSFKADMRQFYLLNKRPLFEKSGKTSSLLRDAICPSIGAYGVFHRDKEQFDMNYYSASILECLRKDLFGRSRHLRMNHDEPATVSRKSPTGEIFSEQQYSDGIIDFGNALEKMLIGTPMSLGEGLTALGDIDIVDAAAEILKNNSADLSGIRQAVRNSPQVISYRTAIVIRGSENNMNNTDIGQLWWLR